MNGIELVKRRWAIKRSNENCRSEQSYEATRDEYDCRIGQRATRQIAEAHLYDMCDDDKADMSDDADNSDIMDFHETAD